MRLLILSLFFMKKVINCKYRLFFECKILVYYGINVFCNVNVYIGGGCVDFVNKWRDNCFLYEIKLFCKYKKEWLFC